MILRNFSIEPSFTEISYNGIWLDLHNDYLWTKTINENGILELIYIKRDAEWVNKDSPIWFCIKIDGIKGIWTKDDDIDYPKEHIENDKNTPDLFGFSYAGNEIMDGPTSNIKLTDNLSALIFTTVTGKTLKVEGKSAEFLEMKKL